MPNAGEIVVKLKAEIAELQKGLTQGANLVRTFANTVIAPLKLVQGTFDRIFTLKNVVIGGAIGLTTKKIIDLGMQAEDTERKFTMAFGDMSAGVRKWSDDLGKSLKRSSDEIRENASDLYLFMTNAGLAKDAAVDLSEQITQLGYAVANARSEDEANVIWSMRAAMMGSTRAIRAYGVEIDDVALKNWAMKNGFDANTKVWTEQQLVLARIGALMEAFAKDAATANTQQSSTRTLLKQVKDAWKALAEEVFEKWKPDVQAYFTAVRDFLIEHQAAIAKWAGIIEKYVAFGARSIGSFLKGFATAPKETMNAFLQSLAAMISTAAEMAVTMAIKVGEGIWKGVKEGILGGETNEKNLSDRAMEIYKEKGGLTTTERTFTGSAGAVGMGYAPSPYTNKEVPLDAVTGYTGSKPLYTWAEAMKEAKAEALAERARAITDSDSLGTQLNQSLSGLGTKLAAIQANSPTGADLEKNLQTLHDSLAELKGEAEQAGGALVEAGTQGASAVNQTTTAIEALNSTQKQWKEAGERMKGVTEIVRAYAMNLEDDLNVTRLLTQKQVEEAEVQKAINTLREKGITLYAEEVTRIRSLIQAKKEAEDTAKLEAYVQDMREEADVQDLINRGKYQEAELQKALNQLRREGVNNVPDAIQAEIKMQAEAKRISDTWGRAAQSIDGSFEDAFVGITKNANDLKSVMTNLASAIRESFARALYQSTIGSFINSAVGGITGSIGQMFTPAGSAAAGTTAGVYQGTTPTTFTAAKGGIVYASSGYFSPKGTDTVPAMLTPGEGVLDVDTTNRLRKILDVGGGSAVSNDRVVALLEQIANKPAGNVAVVHSKDEIFDIIRSREGMRVVAEVNARNG